jgi:predicted Zn-dependent protease
MNSLLFPLRCYRLNSVSAGIWKKTTRIHAPYVRSFSSSGPNRFHLPFVSSSKRQSSTKIPTYVWMTVGGSSVLVAYCYVSFLDRAPLTSRLRWIATSPDWEESMGDQEYRKLIQHFRSDVLPPSHRASITVHRVGHRITEAALDFAKTYSLHSYVQNSRPYTYTVVRSDTANAFVLPGNHVFVMTGLFKFVKNEDELAAVLGHEMAHNLARHAGEKVSGSIVVNILARISLLIDPSGILMTFLLPAATVLRELPNSRQQETEADHIGLHLAARACYDPRAAQRVFGAMKAAETSDVQRSPEFLSTHPTHDRRLEDLATFMPEALAIVERDADRCRHIRADMSLARQRAVREAQISNTQSYKNNRER